MKINLNMSGRGRPPKSIPKPISHNSDLPCSYSVYSCSLPRIENYEYCISHILEDKSAPFQQCSYNYPHSNKQCFRAAFMKDKDKLCQDHSRTSLRRRQKSSLKKRPLETPDLCLDRLSSHHVLPVSSSLHSVPDPASVPSVAATSLKYGSEDESDDAIIKELNVSTLPRLEEDTEFHSTCMEYDVLDNAGIYTKEEAIRIYTSKLQKLKGLYNDQYKHLTHVLKGAKREYYTSIKNERETMGSIHSQPKETAADQNDYLELKSLLGYHRCKGVDALLHKQLIEKRNKDIEIGSINKPAVVKCIFSEGSTRCGEKSVPLSKYCFKHVMQDSNQVLFQICGAAPDGGEECLVPTIPTPLSSTCIYHTPVPSLLPVSNESAGGDLPDFGIAPSHIIDLSDSSAFIVSELPPDNVMEDDAFDHADADMDKDTTISVL